MTHSPVVLGACTNCGRALDGPYCADCGQKAGPVDPPLRDVVHEFVHELANVDGKTFRSVRLLFTCPGFLTREYFQGRRARYVSPLRLYLIFSVIYFGVAAIAPPPQQGGLRVSVTDEEELRELGFESEAALEQAVRGAINTWAPRIMFVLVPFFALLVKLVTPRSGRNYPQHLYFALHVHAAAFACLTLGTLGRYARAWPAVEGVLALAALAASVTYLTLALQRAYDATAARAVVRAAVVSFLYLVVIALAIAGIVLPVVLSGRSS